MTGILTCRMLSEDDGSYWLALWSEASLEADFWVFWIAHVRSPGPT